MEKHMAGFPRSECQVRKLATSHFTKVWSEAMHTVRQQAFTVKIDVWAVSKMHKASAGEYSRTHTEECTVTACRTYV